MRALPPFITATLYLDVTPYFPEHFQPLPDVPNEAVGLGTLCELHAAREGDRTHSGTRLAGDPACSSAQGPKVLSPPPPPPPHTQPLMRSLQEHPKGAKGAMVERPPVTPGSASVDAGDN